MQTENDFAPSTAAPKVASCLWCHQRAAQAEIVRNRGLCRPCAEMNSDFGWRLLYDRDTNTGSIPRNLRDAYGL